MTGIDQKLEEIESRLSAGITLDLNDIEKLLKLVRLQREALQKIANKDLYEFGKREKIGEIASEVMNKKWSEI